MQWYVLDRRIPWILVASVPEGGANVADQRTGEAGFCPDEDCVYAWAADRSAAGGWGLGNAIHRVLGAIGSKRCLPCAKRQIDLNVASNGFQVWTPWG